MSGSCTRRARTCRACARSGWSRRRCSTPSWPPGCSATPASASPRSSSSCAGCGMRKEHSAADWSKRPLPTSWLEYAALDVEVLVEIRDRLARELVESGKDAWAQQEFAHVMAQRPVPRTDPWRRTSGMHKARGRRAVAAVRELWLTRDELAERRDVTPGRIIPDSAIVVAASALPTERSALLGLKGFHGRGAERYADRWVDAIVAARELPESELPPVVAPVRRSAAAPGVGRARPRRRRPPDRCARGARRTLRGAQRPGREHAHARRRTTGALVAAPTRASPPSWPRRSRPSCATTAPVTGRWSWWGRCWSTRSCIRRRLRTCLRNPHR